MAITLDRYCLQRIVDILEGRVTPSEEELGNLIRQYKRKIAIDAKKEQGGAVGGRPPGRNKILDLDLDNGF